MERPRIVFVHTVTGLSTMFTALCRERIANPQIAHIADETMIQAVMAEAGPTPAVCLRLCEHVVHAERVGAHVVQVTCSTVSPCVEAARRLVSIPVLKIDEPAVEIVVARYRRIGVIATNPATLKPTTDLIQEKIAQAAEGDGAPEAGEPYQLRSVLCAEAYDAYLSGDVHKHDTIVLERLRELMGQSEVVLLAQASMARVADMLGKESERTPLVTTPPAAMDYLARLCRELPG